MPEFTPGFTPGVTPGTPPPSAQPYHNPFDRQGIAPNIVVGQPCGVGSVWTQTAGGLRCLTEEKPVKYICHDGGKEIECTSDDCKDYNKSSDANKYCSVVNKMAGGSIDWGKILIPILLITAVVVIIKSVFMIRAK